MKKYQINVLLIFKETSYWKQVNQNAPRYLQVNQRHSPKCHQNLFGIVATVPCHGSNCFDCLHRSEELINFIYYGQLVWQITAF